MRGYVGKCLKSGPDQDKIGDSIERGSVFLSAAAERKLKWQSYLYEPDAELNPEDTIGLNGVSGVMRTGVILLPLVVRSYRNITNITGQQNCCLEQQMTYKERKG